MNDSHAFTRRALLASGAAAAAVPAALAGAMTSQGSAADTFTLWGLPSQGPSQMMSYVVRTAHGELIMIDGGMVADAAYLKGFLAALGNNVHTWIVSHPHMDHVDALSTLLGAPGDLRIGRVLASLPGLDWIAEAGEERAMEPARLLTERIAASEVPLEDAQPGYAFDLGGVRTTILGVRNPEIKANPVNNSSMAWRMEDDSKSVLFLGDLGVEGGDKLLHGPFRSQLPADYVQMAHHGQAGVKRDFYQHVGATACLWPTPRWLWDVDNGGGKGSGPWRTLEVRDWMKELGVTEHYVTADGLHRIG